MYGKLIFEDCSTLYCDLQLNISRNVSSINGLHPAYYYQNYVSQDININITFPSNNIGYQQISKYFPTNNGYVANYKQRVLFQTDNEQVYAFDGFWTRSVNVNQSNFHSNSYIDVECTADYYTIDVENLDLAMKRKMRMKKLERILK